MGGDWAKCPCNSLISKAICLVLVDLDRIGSGLGSQEEWLIPGLFGQIMLLLRQNLVFATTQAQIKTMMLTYTCRHRVLLFTYLGLNVLSLC